MWFFDCSAEFVLKTDAQINKQINKTIASSKHNLSVSEGNSSQWQTNDSDDAVEMYRRLQREACPPPPPLLVLVLVQCPCRRLFSLRVPLSQWARFTTLQPSRALFSEMKAIYFPPSARGRLRAWYTGYHWCIWVSSAEDRGHSHTLYCSPVLSGGCTGAGTLVSAAGWAAHTGHSRPAAARAQSDSSTEVKVQITWDKCRSSASLMWCSFSVILLFIKASV